MDSFLEAALYALGFAALLRDAHYLSKGAALHALLSAGIAWAAFMTRGILYGPSRPIGEHFGFGLLYVAVFFGVTGTALYLRRRAGRRNSDA